MNGSSLSWSGLPIQYADYAAWQQEYLNSKNAEKDRAFWKSALAGVPAILQMPTDRSRPERPAGDAGTYNGQLSAVVVHQAAQFALENHMNIQSILLAAVQVLLMRYTGQDDLVVGVPTAGRDHPETHGLIGYFVNTVPVRCGAAENTNFLKLARDASTATLSALSHAHLPFQQIVELTDVARIPGANPLIQVLCQYMPRNDIGMPHFSGLEMDEMLAGSLAQAKFDLAFHFSDRGDYVIEYMSELFDRSTIERIAKSLTCLLTDALQDPAQSVFVLSMIGKEDHGLVQKFSRGAVREEFSAEPLVHQVFERVVTSHPAKACLAYKDEELCFEEVSDSCMVSIECKVIVFRAFSRVSFGAGELPCQPAGSLAHAQWC